MIKSSFLDAQIAKARQTRRTPLFLKRLIFSVVDQVAHAHYGAEYAIKCLQTSSAIASLLRCFEIRSRAWVGALCAAEVFENGSATWGGFWGDDHHVWLVTEFRELVDLNISQLHSHPKSRRTDEIPVPAIWWNDLGRWPPVLRYLPDSPISIGLEGADRTDLVTFQAKVREELASEVAHGYVDKIAFGPMLENIGTMNFLHEQGNAWLNRAILFQDRHIPFPDWIRHRERELTEAHYSGERASSPLSSRRDLIRIDNTPSSDSPE